MSRLLVSWLLVLSSFAGFAASAHVVDLCQDLQDCAEEQPVTEESPVNGLPHDCSCPAHHHNCSHHPVHGARVSALLNGPANDARDFLSSPAVAISAPYLEGPFQPPKA